MATFTHSTPIIVIQEALKTLGVFDNIKDDFNNPTFETYGDAIQFLNTSILEDRSSRSRIIRNLLMLSDRNSQEINDGFIYTLLSNRAISYQQALLLWRRVKNAQNISDDIKMGVIQAVKGQLPRMENPREWHFLMQDGTINTNF